VNHQFNFLSPLPMSVVRRQRRVSQQVTLFAPDFTAADINMLESLRSVKLLAETIVLDKERAALVARVAMRWLVHRVCKLFV